MNVYEDAHNLAAAIRASNEFKEFDAKKKALDQDEDSKKMVSDFQQLQIQIQTKAMMGEEPDQSAMGQMQAMYAMLLTKPLAAEYMQAEMRFSIMMKDVYEILADVMNIGLK